jgi:hypothetical protein
MRFLEQETASTHLNQKVGIGLTTKQTREPTTSTRALPKRRGRTLLESIQLMEKKLVEKPVLTHSQYGLLSVGKVLVGRL